MQQVRSRAIRLSTIGAIASAFVGLTAGCMGNDAACPLPRTTLTPALDRSSFFSPKSREFSLDGAMGEVSVVPGAVQKVCKLTGEMDREIYNEAPNRTESRAGLIGTDLGISFSHHGKLFFLFGDSVPVDSSKHPWENDDSIAVSVNGTADNCMNLNFVRQSEHDYKPLVIPSIAGGVFDVPTGGFSLNDHMYMFYATDHSAEKIMGRSILARSDDEGSSWKKVTEVSSGAFINIAAWPNGGGAETAIDSQSAAMGEGVFMFGSGTYRESQVSLAFAPARTIEDKSTWKYLSGSALGLPLWSSQEGAAVPITHESCVGEISVAWNPYLQRWIMLYNCGGGTIESQSGIHMKTALHPWGPWSVAETIFNPVRDQGFCHFMHQAWKFPDGVLDSAQVCDCISEPNQQGDGGGEYGPYLIPSLFTGGSGYSTIYFTMSTHNPYNTVLMKALIGFQ